MMYQAWSRPGRKPRPGRLSVFEWSVRVRDIQHSAMLIKLSALHNPRFTQTASGGKMIAIRPRQTSEPHIVSFVFSKGASLMQEGRGRKTKDERWQPDGHAQRRG